MKNGYFFDNLISFNKVFTFFLANKSFKATVSDILCCSYVRGWTQGSEDGPWSRVIHLKSHELRSFK